MKRQRGRLVTLLWLGGLVLCGTVGISGHIVTAAEVLQSEKAVLTDETDTKPVPAHEYVPKEYGDDQETVKTIQFNSYGTASQTTTQSGTYGSMAWSVQDGTLTITGNGAMPDASASAPVPWGSLNVSKVVIGEGITTIGKENFYNMNTITEVQFPSTLQKINEAAFYMCSGILKVNLPVATTTIEKGAFADCMSMTDFSAPGLTSIENYALQRTKIKTFEIPKGVTTLPQNLLFGNTALTDIKVAAGNTAYVAVDGILYSADGSVLVLYPSARVNLQFTVPTGVKVIGQYAFTDTQYLQTVGFANVTKLEDGAFYQSSLAGTLVLSDQIKEVGNFTFESSANITAVKFGTGLVETNYRMFEDCTGIQTIDFGGLQKLYMRTFSGCNGLVEVTLPDRMKEWGGSVFNSCSNLKTFTAKGLEEVVYADFAQCYALESVNLGAVKKIYRQAFANCPSLKQITLPACTQWVDANAFEEGVQVNCQNKELVKYGQNGLHYAEEITISGTRDYQNAFSVLALVNEQRAANGLSALTMDTGLLETAMIRAGEQQVLFSHTRPDGTSCYMANKDMSAENVAIGQQSAAAVMDSWMKSEGHRKNILTASYTTIGIGCFYINGTYTWVQCFGSSETSNTAVQPANQTISQSMYIPKDTFSEAATTSGIIWGELADYTYKMELYLANKTGKIGESEQITPQIVNPGFSGTTPFTSVNLKWESSDTKVAKVDAAGTVTFMGKGKAKITASTKYYTASIDLNVTASGKDGELQVTKITLKNKYAIYTGKAIKIDKANITGSKGKVTYTYYSDAKCRKKLKGYPKKIGTYYVRATVAATKTHESATSNIAKLVIQKKNPVTVRVQSKRYKGRGSKCSLSKTRTFQIGVKKAKGKVSYSRSKNCGKYITVTKKGKVTVKKGTPKGTYTITVKAAGKGVYAKKTIKVKITVKK